MYLRALSRFTNAQSYMYMAISTYLQYRRSVPDFASPVDSCHAASRCVELEEQEGIACTTGM